MDLQLNGKRAVVAGSTAGVGLATAQLLAREGAAVVINGRTKARVDEAVGQVRRADRGANVSGVAADLVTVEACAALTRGASRKQLRAPASP
jgi:NAD(P)-dependent dehydrogenase (short-subunit alcohol dehydrogenase family)